MNTKSTRNRGTTQKASARKSRYYRTFLLMQQFAAEEIGARIAQARREAGGMTQETLAEALDLSVRQLQNIEAGASIPWKHFNRLEVIFERPLGWFLHGEELAKETEGALVTLDARLQALESRVAQLAPAAMVQEGFAGLEEAIVRLSEQLSAPAVRRR